MKKIYISPEISITSIHFDDIIMVSDMYDDAFVDLWGDEFNEQYDDAFVDIFGEDHDDVYDDAYVDIFGDGDSQTPNYDDGYNNFDDFE